MRARCGLAAALAVAIANAQSLPVFPNIGYGAVGYNIIRGNPLSDGSASGGVDPGFSLTPIFAQTYSTNQTFENHFSVPDNFQVLRDSSCSYSAAYASSVVTTFSQYQAVVAAGGGLGIGLLNLSFAFSGSASAGLFFQANSSSSDALLTYTAACTSYKVGTNPFGPLPAFSAAFAAGVAALPTSLSAPGASGTLADFVNAFGTHYPTSLVMGGNSFAFISVKSSDFETLLRLGVDVHAAAQINFLLAVNASVGAGGNMSSYLQVMSVADNSGAFGIPTIAIPCPSGNCDDVSAWQAEVDANPYPMQYSLASITDLLTPANFPSDPAIAAKALALALYLAGDYCSALGNLCWNANPLQGVGAWFAPTVQGCPQGWAERPDVAGRMLLSVADSEYAGLSLGAALPDGQEPQHFHDASSNFNFGTRGYVIADGSDGELSHSGSQGMAGAVEASASGYPFVQLRFCAFTAPNADGAPVMPYGSALYILPDTMLGCPASFTPYLDANGRFIVPSSAPSSAAASFSSPLAPGADVEHGHSGSIAILETAPATCQSCMECGCGFACNCNPGQGGAYSAPLAVATGPLNLSYVSLQTCLSTAQTFTPSAPSGFVLLDTLGGGCPEGWATIDLDISGRIPIATQPFGTPGKSLGSAQPITTQNYTTYHTHSYAIPFAPSVAGLAAIENESGGDAAAADTYTVSGQTEVSGGGAYGVPYILVQACVAP